jgi:Ankyrin repeats (3 copies)
MGKKSKNNNSSNSNGTVPKPANNLVSDGNDKDDKDVPLVEMSKEEYDDLLVQINELTLEEVQMEWMESCRYGEVDVVRALTASSCNRSQLSNYVDPSGLNTGLHMAAANNHVNVVRYLLEDLHHPFTTNSSGNTPLHWAAANGHGEVVEYLTTHPSVVTVDVLQKNCAGRSALTEGFTSQKESVVKALLEHDSASEEKLLSAGVPVDDDDNDDDGKENEKHEIGEEGETNCGSKSAAAAAAASHVHHFFDIDKPLLIRELAMKNADNPFADDCKPDQDTTGLSIWSASLVAALWMIDLVEAGEARIVGPTKKGPTKVVEDEIVGTAPESSCATNESWTALELGMINIVVFLLPVALCNVQAIHFRLFH